ncbi:MAG: helix-turn-helix domain-containing protein [Solirubrobacteraceae bacterium]
MTGLDTSLHDRRRAERLRDPEYRDAYEQASQEIAQTDQVIGTLDALRVDMGVSKAELARRIDRNPSSIRRLFTAQQARPELALVAAIADALGAEVRVVARTSAAKKVVRKQAVSNGQHAAA